MEKIHKERCVICVAIELKIKVSPHLSTHTPDSLLKSVMPSGQKQPSVVKFKVGSLGLALKKEKIVNFIFFRSQKIPAVYQTRNL